MKLQASLQLVLTCLLASVAQAQSWVSEINDIQFSFKTEKQGVVLVHKADNEEMALLTATVTNKGNDSVEFIALGTNPAVLAPIGKTLKAGKSTDVQVVLNLKAVRLPTVGQMVGLFRTPEGLKQAGTSLQVALDGTAIFVPFSLKWQHAEADTAKTVKALSLPQGVTVESAEIEENFSFKQNGSSFEITPKTKPSKPGWLRIKLSDGKTVNVVLFVAAPSSDTASPPAPIPPAQAPVPERK